MHGAAKNRAGTKYVAATKDSSAAGAAIPFVFSSTQTYMLEFGNLYVRFHQNGGQVVAAGVPYEVVTPVHHGDAALSRVRPGRRHHDHLLRRTGRGRLRWRRGS
jgi:hypothetical protein